MNTEIKVWDPLVRIFHWALVVAFFVAYFTEGDELLGPHVWAGYVALGLVIFRIVWGFVGSKYARFSDFVVGPGAAFRYALEAVRGRAARYIGHNPAGGFMIMLLLVMLLATTISGLLVYGADQHAGPFKGFFAATATATGAEGEREGAMGEREEEEESEEEEHSAAMTGGEEDEGAESGEEDATEEMLEELHEVLTNITFVLVIIHVLGVIFESRLHKENLARAMVTGKKRAS
jgi:cytochrome b